MMSETVTPIQIPARLPGSRRTVLGGLRLAYSFNLTLGAVFMPYATAGTESKPFLYNHMLPGTHAANRKAQTSLISL